MQIENTPGSTPDVRILKLGGPFTLATMFDFQSVIRDSPSPVTIVDLSGVPYMDSAALGSLLGLHASSLRQGHKYALAAIPDRLMTLFKMTGVENMVVRYESVQEAEKALVGG